MRVTAVQMNQGDDKVANIAQAQRLIEAAASADRPDLVTLPETWTNLGGDRGARHAAAEVLPPVGAGARGGEAYEFMRSMAQVHRIHLHGGSIIEQSDDRLFNTTLVFNPDGQEIARYRKIHLFDIVAPDGAGYRESATYGAGDEIVTFQVNETIVGCTICYDLRFAELFIALRCRGAELIMVPSNFTLQTGKDHWEVLLRARAIETQCWIAAAASWGQYVDRGVPRAVYGHSLVCNPWGHVVAKASDGIGWTTARIDPEITARVREGMATLEHRSAARARYAKGGP